MRKFICLFTILNILISNTFVYAEPETTTELTTEVIQSTVAETGEPIINAETAVVIDPETGIVLYDKNADQKMYPASITKIMTALLVIEYAENSEKGFNDIITHSHNAVYNIGPGSSHIGMREDEQITLDNALYGIMLASANEVCMAVAEHIDGSVENFVDHMNQKAKELGAVNTHFANPHGFHDENHYTTAHDMAIIMAEAVKHKDFVRYISTYQHQIPFTNIVQEIRYLHNSNKLISPYSKYQWEGCIGGKTGFHDDAGNTLVIYGGNGDKKFVSAVMKEKGNENAYTDSRTLIEYAETLYNGNTIDVFSENNIITDLNIIHNGTMSGTASIAPTENFKIELPEFMSADDINIDIVTADNINAPVGTGKIVGTAYALYNGNVLYKTPLAVSQISDTESNAVDFMSLNTAEKTSNNNILFTILIIIGSIVAVLLLAVSCLYIYNQIQAKKRRKMRLKMREIEKRERRRAHLERMRKLREENNDKKDSE